MGERKQIKTPKKNGRPVINLEWREFEQLCMLQCSITEICAWFHISHQTLERRCKEHYGETFGQVFAKKRIGGLISLRRNLFKQSEKNPACAIFLAKNLLGMADKQEITGAEGGPVKHEIIVKTESAKKLTQQIIAGEGT